MKSISPIIEITKSEYHIGARLRNGWTIQLVRLIPAAPFCGATHQVDPSFKDWTAHMWTAHFARIELGLIGYLRPTMRDRVANYLSDVPGRFY